jgi:hypothetical protein
MEHLDVLCVSENVFTVRVHQNLTLRESLDCLGPTTEIRNKLVEDGYAFDSKPIEPRHGEIIVRLARAIKPIELPQLMFVLDHYQQRMLLLQEFLGFAARYHKASEPLVARCLHPARRGAPPVGKIFGELYSLTYQPDGSRILALDNDTAIDLAIDTSVRYLITDA